MKRFFLPYDLTRANSVREALLCGLQATQSIGSELLIVTPLKNLDTIDVGKEIGTAVSRKLMKGETAQISGVRVSYQSMGAIHKIRHPGTVVAFYLDEKDLLKLDDVRMDCLICVPWTPDQGLAGARKWGANYLGSATPPSPIDLAPAIISALEDLSHTVNLSTGLLHPSDKRDAQQTFARLRTAHLCWNPEEVEKWAARAGWSASGANELAIMARSYC